MSELKKCMIPDTESEEITIYVMDLMQFFRERLSMGAFKDIIKIKKLKKNIQEISKYVKTLLKADKEFYIKIINGKEYIVFKGYPGLRTFLNGTKYSGSAPVNVVVKIAQKKIGQQLLSKNILISIVSTVGLKIIEHVFKDEFVWSNFLSETITSVRNDIISLLVGTVAASLATVALTTMAAAPLVVGALPFVVFLAVSYYVKEELEKGLLDRLYNGVNTYYKESSKKLYYHLKSREDMHSLMKYF